MQEERMRERERGSERERMEYLAIQQQFKYDVLIEKFRV